LNERFHTFIEDSQSNACVWDVHCADYKNHNKDGDAIDFLAKKYEKGDAIDFLAKNFNSALLKLRKKSPISEVSSGESIKKL
jgi:hypothetical protein